MRGRLTNAEREASRWIVRLESDDVSLDDHRGFRRWLDADPANRTAYEAMSRIWDKLDALKHLEIADSVETPSRRGFLLAGAGAAAAAVAGIAWLATPRPAAAAIYETPIGGRRHVPLHGASSAELNAASRLVVSPDARRVVLERGEALFDIQQNDAVELATDFGVLATRDAQVLLKLANGAARATLVRGAAVATSAARGASVAVAMGEEIILDGAGATKTALASGVSDRRLAWRSGMLSFDGESLREAAADVERQTGVRFAFADAPAAELQVGGYIRADDADAFVELVEENLGLTAERQGDGSIRFASH